MSTLFESPSTTKGLTEEKTSGGIIWCDGKLTQVSPQQGVTAITIAGGNNPGFYVFKSTITGGLEAALCALSMNAPVSMSVDPTIRFQSSKGEIQAFFVNKP
ncbi:MAG: hypothetical protein WAL56_12100 [Candidatus Sulfotelmatobacter sp.]